MHFRVLVRVGATNRVLRYIVGNQPGIYMFVSRVASRLHSIKHTTSRDVANSAVPLWKEKGSTAICIAVDHACRWRCWFA